MKSLLLIAVVVYRLVSALGYGTIPIKFKGNTLSVDDYLQLDLCTSKWCLSDANRIVEEMSYNNSVNPCDDFNEFACGTFFRERAYNERYESVGFKTSYEKKLDEKRHKIFKAPIEDNDVKAVKVTKNFYKRCVTSSKQAFMSLVSVSKYLRLFF